MKATSIVVSMVLSALTAEVGAQTWTYFLPDATSQSTRPTSGDFIKLGTSGQGTVSYALVFQQSGSKEWRIHVLGEEGGTLHVVAALPNTRVSEILLQERPDTSGDGAFTVIVDEEPGASFEWIEEINHDFTFTDAKTDLQIDQLSGTLGTLGSIRGGTVNVGTISKIRVDGDVTVTGGIQLLDVEGAVGTASLACDIETDQSAGTTVGIDEMEAASVHANIDSYEVEQLIIETGDLTGSLTLDQVPSDFSTAISVAGDFDADMDVATFVDADIEIGGDLTGDIVIDEGLASDRTITIDGSLDTNASISLGSSAYQTGGVGLAGQIIINADDGAGAWDGEVRILKDIPANDIVLSGQGYATKALFLGGGAAGVDNYDLHGEDCLPAHNANINGIVLVARARNYGPISFTGTTPVTVWRRPAPVVIGSSFTDVTSDYSFAVSATNARDLIVTPTRGTSTPGISTRSSRGRR